MDVNEIKEALKLYFDGSFESSGEKIATVFNGAAHVYGHDGDGALRDMDIDSFVKLVESGASRKPRPVYPRHDEILSIEFTGVNTAIARVKIRVLSTMFTDILSFIRLDGKWTIISKLYSGVPIE